MARAAVGAFYLVLALTLGLVYTWEWAAVILLAGVVPGVAVFYGAAYGGEFIAELSRRRWDDGRGGTR
jgi:hydrogenase/urease accessory protein HupE